MNLCPLALIRPGEMGPSVFMKFNTFGDSPKVTILQKAGGYFIIGVKNIIGSSTFGLFLDWNGYNNFFLL